VTTDGLLTKRILDLARVQTASSVRRRSRIKELGEKGSRSRAGYSERPKGTETSERRLETEKGEVSLLSIRHRHHDGLGRRRRRARPKVSRANLSARRVEMGNHLHRYPRRGGFPASSLPRAAERRDWSSASATDTIETTKDELGKLTSSTVFLETNATLSLAPPSDWTGFC
jgi:hypothetical protein